MQGYNGTIIAYGQTGSGKSFTMTGPDIENESLQGIIPRTINAIFKMHAEQNNEYVKIAITISYVQVYLEEVNDLLNIKNKNLKLSTNKATGVCINGVTSKDVGNAKQLLEFMKAGDANRVIASTKMNETSSRSHSIFIITITQENSLEKTSTIGKLLLVDLAGSEKVDKTGATGKTLKEANKINLSLSFLGMVIKSLADTNSKIKPPYRESQLTQILRGSIGGNSKTALIITCSPLKYNFSETISTLKFGERAKEIKSNPRVNIDYTKEGYKLHAANLEGKLSQINVPTTFHRRSRRRGERR